MLSLLFFLLPWIIRMTTQTLNFHLYPLNTNKKSLSGFITKLSLLKSQLVCLLLSGWFTGKLYLLVVSWQEINKLQTLNHSSSRYKCATAFAIREMCSYNNLAYRILLQRLIYFPCFFALILLQKGQNGSPLEYLVAGQRVCV